VAISCPIDVNMIDTNTIVRENDLSVIVAVVLEVAVGVVATPPVVASILTLTKVVIVGATFVQIVSAVAVMMKKITVPSLRDRIATVVTKNTVVLGHGLEIINGFEVAVAPVDHLLDLPVPDHRIVAGVNMYYAIQRKIVITTLLL